MNNFSSGSVQEASTFSVAFSSQYISVILIILTFVIGAFGSQRLKDQKTVQEAAQTLVIQPVFQPTNETPEALVGEMIYDDLFISGEETLNPERARTIAKFLLAHDIRLEADIPVEGLADRPIALARFLVEAGVPVEAIYIWGTTGAPNDEITLRFLRDQK